MTTVINLWGGPGIGKSTTAAHLFAEMKLKNINCELVREAAKDFAWAGMKLDNIRMQMAVTSEQMNRESLLYGKVDYIITDAPILMGQFYCLALALPISNFLLENREIQQKNFLLRRHKVFNPAGRFHSEERSQEIDKTMETFLMSKCNPIILSCQDVDRASEIMRILNEV